jgi:hypothetical protein
MGKRAHFEFRAESYNTFNHTQFNGFHSNISGSDFGEVSGVQIRAPSNSAESRSSN